MNPEIIGVLVSLTATVASAFVANLSERSRGSKSTNLELAKPSDDPMMDSRLSELRDALTRQKTVARLNGWADSSLTFGQYVVGGLLASSFVQESLSNQIIGALGVLVLLSSLIRQRYRPDIKAVGAKRRVVLIRSFIREVEDTLYTLNTAQENAPSICDIRRKVSERLAKFEESELADAQQNGDEASTG